MFTTVLVANRGEIACRVIATLRRLGIRSVAVYSDADRHAAHVALANTAVRIGPAEPRASYLSVDAVLDAARATGADAIHPGYGFLSENPDLAKACEAAGIVFVGPGIEALAVMGDKIRAKKHVAAAGVPVIPGVALPGLSDDEVVAAADRVGYPLIVKPSAGGGGKGMTVVTRPSDLQDALAASRRVAGAAFGDDTLLLERYVSTPRHIEVQLLADAHGTVIHLGERECSLQRRHQKVVEEAPSPLLDEPTRRRIGAAACEVARSVGYLGAGTVEFLVSDDDPTQFFFMEMNTRLQVEHPVTELVTGLDLVEWQLRIAAGQPLTVTQDDVHLTGHAVEARVYAEDPSRDFLPTVGTVRLLDEPTGDGIRVDSSLRPGLEIGSTYDPMLSKVIAWGPSRDEAVARLDAALARTTVLGVTTNIPFLRRVLAEPDVRAGRLDTGLLGRMPRTLTDQPRSTAAVVAATLWRHLALRSAHLRTAAAVGGVHSAAGSPQPTGPAFVTGVHDPGTGTRPADGTVTGARSRQSAAWRPDGWRLGDPRPARYDVLLGADTVLDVVVQGSSSSATVTVGDDAPVRAGLVVLDADSGDLELAGVVQHVRVATDGPVTWVGIDGSSTEVRFRSRVDRLAHDLAALVRGERPADPVVRSPMPGIVVSVAVQSGDDVVAGQTLLTIEAMKMEHRVVAPRDGTVTLTVRPTDRVALDHVVATIAGHPHEGTPS